MNIKEAKEQIRQAVEAYRQKNEFGEYVIPVEQQRPIFLMGAPGIGKTAVMEQIAREMGIGLVSYSMTHHTRQSALGLPFIETKTYRGQEYQVSEYTMSEIIASVYEQIEKHQLEEGILFLDEINCVSVESRGIACPQSCRSGLRPLCLGFSCVFGLSSTCLQRSALLRH